MNLRDRAWDRTLWRGAYYFEDKKVISYEDIGDERYKGKVSGSNGEVYDVCIDVNHPEESTCTCPFATHRKSACKHMIALLFTVHPTEYDMFNIEEDEDEKEDYLDDIKCYVYGLSLDELRSELIGAMVEIDELKGLR